MVKTIQVTELTLHDVKVKFDLTPAEDDQFFREWQDELPELSDTERQSLEQIKAHMLYLEQYPMVEDIVKMVVLSPLLGLAGFYGSPFHLKTEAAIEIAAVEEHEILRGRIDVLVLQEQFWVLVIESKQAGFSLKSAIPQALTYMMANPNQLRPSFGLVTNGTNFRFLKLTKSGRPMYALSDEFTLYRGNDWYNVLRILKRIAQLVVN
ncbi:MULTISPECIES: type I restriction enzyme HsdR N-terminal domain-containing protein [unclassified Moorena]|uniref:type I restriction enzyme HsdR N-terminal domain-containing protein n=1 Tax=unclassified Moorena TaxID=2683338 RepID=UPI0013FF9BAD|nr:MULTISPECIES: type I restriction enzyme HsdR N-terminal domain-containing protein [unclassified Moorena]NEO16680.1 restriction endonuclease subunit R [Moorena sp. SIO3E8]NEP98639.1 restriction endonuclease subunit R [Moorena sp. SIO3F7]